MSDHVRTGGDLTVETLEALGTSTVFGIPGQHALGLFDALSRSQITFISSRVENNAAFAADGYARATGRPGVLFLSTGPGALTSLAGLEEAYATGVPLIVVASQIPSVGMGGRRMGHLHQLDDQKESARNVTKDQFTVRHTSAIPSTLEDAWSTATTAPQGPVWVEIPQDILLGVTEYPPVRNVSGDPATVAPRKEAVAHAADLLTRSHRTAVVAGGGVRQSGAEKALLDLIELLGAPVICSPGGVSAIPENHPLTLGFIEDIAVTEVLEDAEVLLVLGSSIGEVTSNYYTMAPRGTIVHVDAEQRVLEANHPAVGIRSDASEFLRALRGELLERRTPVPEQWWGGRTSTELVAATNSTVVDRLAGQDLNQEQRFLADIRAAVPCGMLTFWDMTIAAYWAWNVWGATNAADVSTFHSAQGAGGLGFGFPAALGAAAGTGKRVLAVAGDGSSMYSIAELASARQHNLPVTWLIIDDGGYGILREYMTDAFGGATATELSRPDFVALAQSFGVPAERVPASEAIDALQHGFTAEGPNVVVVDTTLAMWAPTHLGRD